MPSVSRWTSIASRSLFSCSSASASARFATLPQIEQTACSTVGGESVRLTGEGALVDVQRSDGRGARDGNLHERKKGSEVHVRIDSESIRRKPMPDRAKIFNNGGSQA